jgi:hypothetical protein
MPVIEDLLVKARAAGSNLEEAERRVLLARAEYHTAVRRMHLAGGSLREIAEALNISHQRVQQMVNGAGGSWWSRVWRARNVKRDAVCSFCERPPSELAALIAGPDVYICDKCVERASVRANSSAGSVAAEPGAASQVAPPVSGAMEVAREGDRARCSFCGKGADRPVVKTASANICAECLGICQDILRNRDNALRDKSGQGGGGQAG